jgi:hypothetical protein
MPHAVAEIYILSILFLLEHLGGGWGGSDFVIIE